MSDKSSMTRGVIWLFISKFFPPAITFAVFTYTARILSPEDFGLVAFALAVIFLAACLLPSGWRDGLIKFEEIDSRHISSVFWFNLLVALVISAVLIGFSYLPLFRFQTDVFNLALRILCLKLLVDGLFNTLNAVLLREQKYTTIAVRVTLSTFLSAAIIIALIQADFGVWALIWSQVILSVVNFIAVLIPTRGYLKCYCSLRILKSMASFGWYSTVTTGLSELGKHYDSVIIGSFLGNKELGFFNVAKRLSDIVSDICIGTINDVNFPLLASQQSDFERVRSSFQNSVYLTSMLLFPVFTLLFIEADLIFSILFTEQWSSAVGVFQAFCIILFSIALGVPQKSIILICDHAQWWVRRQVTLLMIIMPLTALAASQGMALLLVVFVFSKFIFCSISMIKSCDLLDLKLTEYLGNIRVAILGCLSFSAVLYVAESTFQLHPVINLVVDAAIAASIYLFVVMLLDYQRVKSTLCDLMPRYQPLFEKLECCLNLIFR
ncbi:oligosaccharide flippase family protein [Endozoicomonas arenosclerae]|uniref:oligosaccharide flippase family protein n=1 Tax=Endozoicomonas arenosclerae TaxID=1633495 RepID=UPI0007857597|nr:oligosaccharide flippase family protein [Endozoicomonas arenosclerae]